MYEFPSLVLFFVTIAISFIVVRIGAIAFELTGINWDQALFQSLSCFTGTGFTTREAELITGHSERRKIASFLMVLGNAGVVTLIVSFSNYLNQGLERLADDGSVVVPVVELRVSAFFIQVGKLLLIALLVYLLYKFFLKSRLWERITVRIRRQMKEKGIITPVAFEELIVGDKGYGIIKLVVSEKSELCDRSLAESNLRRDYDIQVLAIERGEMVIPNPTPNAVIKSGDNLLCFGKRRQDFENLKNIC